MPAPGSGPLFYTFGMSLNYTIYNRTAVRPLGRDWTVDTDADNLASVLMLHIAGGIAFTGDSAGYKIATFLGQAQAAGHLNLPLAVFKVPHHGSLRNCQRAEAIASVPDVAWQEHGLLCVLADPVEWDAVSLPERLRDPGALAVARADLGLACAAWNVDPARLKTELLRVYNASMAAIGTGNILGFQAADASFQTAELWKSLVLDRLWRRAMVDAASRNGAAQPRTTRNSAQSVIDTVSVDWYAAFASRAALADAYLGRLAFGQLKDFFRGVGAQLRHLR